MKFRQANLNDIEGISKIVLAARKALKEKGIDQWQDGYPNESDFERDISKKSCYVFEENGEIIGMSSLVFGIKKEYEEIDGTWLTNQPYAVIHRVGVAHNQTGRRISHKLLDELEKICLESGVNSIRVDTCPNNEIMNRLIYSRGYKLCGITQGIGGIRNAYEKTLDSEILAKV